MLATRNTTACARVHHSSTTASQRRALSAEAAFQAGLPTLDAIDLVATLRKRVSTLRTAFRAGLQLVADDSFADSSLRERKLFYLAARMLLHRTPAEARIPTAELERRCELFRRGEWLCLLTAAGAARLRLEAACGRWDACSREPAPLPRLLRSAQLHGQPGCSAVERPRLLLLRSGRLQPRLSSCRYMHSIVLPDQHQTCTSSPTPVGPADLSRAAPRAPHNGRVERRH